MLSTSKSRCAYAVHALSILSLLAAVANAHAHHPALQPRPIVNRGLSTMTYQGCFSSSDGLTDQGSWTYQTSGYCQPICVNATQSVLATTEGSNCFCGDVLPPADSKVDDSKCNTPCDGYDTENCGGIGFWSVYLSGLETTVPNYSGSDSSTASSSAASSAAATTSPSQTTPATTATPSVITSVAPGQTVVVTMPASQSSSAAATSSVSAKSSKPNVAGIAAGVVVGVVAVAAIIAGVFFFLRRRKQQAAEDDYTRKNQISDFMRGGNEELKPPPTAYSNMSDSRLDPGAGRRNSIGSIADDQDYSRRILKVANPDSGN